METVTLATASKDRTLRLWKVTKRTLELNSLCWAYAYYVIFSLLYKRSIPTRLSTIRWGLELSKSCVVISLLCRVSQRRLMEKWFLFAFLFLVSPHTFSPWFIYRVICYIILVVLSHMLRFVLVLGIAPSIFGKLMTLMQKMT